MKMTLAIICLTACLAVTAFGQPGGNRVAFGTHLGLNKYWGTMSDNQFWLGGDIFLRYNIIPEISLHGVFGLSQIRYKVNEQNIRSHPEYFGAFGEGVGTGVYPGIGTPINREDINTVRVNTYAVLLSYNVFASQSFVPYLFGGAGVVNFEPRNKNQNVALPNNRDNIYKKTVMVIPVGIGVEWYMTDNLTLNAKAQMHLVNSDYLDDLADPGTSNDAFATFGVGFSYYIYGSVDCDKDGLSDSEERRLGLDACNLDTDGDGLNDFEEVRTYSTNALKGDTDDDGLNDFEEVRTYKTNPNNPDTDSDGLKDGSEIARKTDPKNPDTDGDELTDGDEVNQYKTDPTKGDTDGDALSDKVEIRQYNTNPLSADSDTDGLNDGQEINQYKTDPLKTDSDGDELTDGDEVKQYKTSPTNKDTDNDKLTDGQEVLRVKTNPLNPDTDNDRVIDGDDACPLIPGVAERNGCPAPPKIGTILNFPSIYFLFNTDEFDFSRPETDESLAKLLAYVKQCPGLGVAIEGHASREGGDKQNQELSERRAARIKSWLMERGVEQKTVVSSTGYGSRMNAVPEPDPKSAAAKKMDPKALEEIRSQNRRIAVKVVRTCDAN
jgi:outer membrane protein OmpA-like peptidoglycan-associated protein/opacity protein-like surface antigen